MKTRRRGTIGASPFNRLRETMLDGIFAAGYRGKVSATAYYAADIYTVDDSGWSYDGRYGYYDPRWMPVNLGRLYTELVTSKR